tara:strand:- start:272 stop:1060 length:789 start_codon:yes stop_codon:yes gene_type:complete
LTNPKVSILIANYNNAKFINECLESLIKQTYKNIEIILFDDFSKDNSIDEIEKFKNVTLLKNIKKTDIGSFNQMNAYEKAFEISSGEIILFLDSDDYFHNMKIENVVNFFNNNKDAKIVFDLPIIKDGKSFVVKKKKKKIFNNFWPYIHPQSCISIKKENLEEIFKKISIKLFPDIWMDFRICLYSKYILNEFHILNKNLTYYRKSTQNISSKFIYLNRSWWKRRMQAHEYVKYFFKKENISYTKNLDYFITKFYNKIMLIK